MMPVDALLADFFTLVREKDLEGISTVLGDGPVDDPRSGRLVGRENIDGCLRDWSAFLRQGHWSPARVSLISEGDRVVGEWVLQRPGGELPVFLAADRQGEEVRGLRIYHSNWPLLGKHFLRRPILEPVPAVDAPEVVMRYLQAVTEADAEGVLELFTEDGYVREPSGSAHRHEGPEGRARFYRAALAGGGVGLVPCAVAGAGEQCAVEYTIETWGAGPFQPQAGAAVFDLDGGRLIRAVRIYDDIAVPFSL